MSAAASKALPSSKFPLGSEWRRWDLHIHTPESVLENGFGKDWDAYIDGLEKATIAHGIAAIGITDYFTIEGYKKVLEYRQKGRLKSVQLLVPNLEFRITPQTGKGKAINIHLLVSPEDPDHVGEIERAMRRLEFSYNKERYGCFRDDLIKLGRAYDSKQTDEFGAYKRGIEIFKPDFSEFEKWYGESSWLQNNSLVAISNGADGASGLSKDSGFAGIREELYRFSHIVFSSREEDRKYFLGQGTDDEAVVLQKAGSLKPCVCGSDAHSIERFFESDQKRYCWIKADPTFEGLRQILHEPAERIWIGATPPRPIDESRVIGSLSFGNGTDWFENRTVEINPGLVAIIGEKGSGKTAIVDLIAYATAAWDGTNSSTSFISKADEFIRDLSVEISWRHGEKTSAHLGNEPPTEPVAVRYLSQDFVERLCSADTSAGELVKAIEEVVFSYLDDWERLDASDFTELRRLQTEHLDKRRTTIREMLTGLNRDIERLRGEKASRAEKIAVIAELKQSIKALDEQLPGSATGVDQKVSDDLQKARTALQQKQDELAKVSRALTRISSLPAAIEDYRGEIKSGFVELVKTAGAVGISSEALAKLEPALSRDFDKLVLTRRAELEISSQALRGDPAKIDPDGTTVADIEAQVGALEKKLATDDQLRNRMIALQTRRSKAETDLKRLEREVDRIEKEVEVELNSKLAERWKQYLLYFDTLAEERTTLEGLYEPVTKALGSDPKGAKVGFELHAKQGADHNDWLERGRALFDQRNSNLIFKQKDIRSRMDRLARAWSAGEKAAIRKELESFETDLIGGSGNVADELNSHASTSDVEDWLFSPEHVTVEYGLRYEGTDLSALSPGQRGIILLVLYLELGGNDTRPLIIDQPEGNLDNASIYESLVPYLRRARAKRQIILVTHNPNLVVGTDVDQVIVATAKKDGAAEHPRITYRSGGLEDAAGPDSIRELVCQLLEGGREAFKLRESKYAIRN